MSRTGGIDGASVPTRVSQRRVAIAVAVDQASLGIPFTLGQAGEIADLGLHHRLRQHPDSFTQEISVTIGDRC